ncbi:putative cucumisin-like [Capsicum annuum]|nr:putative cucumisin-like [Capsicum annuum]
MVHGILQFTQSITFRYVLHLCESRDIRCQESFFFTEEAQVPPTHAADGARGAGYRFKYSLALSVPGFVGRPASALGRAHRGWGGGARAECRSTPPARTPQLLNTFEGSFCCAGFGNDPSAGSPTKTFLGLLLHLNDKVQWTSRDVAGSEPPTSPLSKYFTGSFNR